MKIRSAEELEQAIHEVQRLERVEAGSPEAKRRDDLMAAIKAYYVEHRDEIETAKPTEEAFDRSIEGHPGETELSGETGSGRKTS